MGIITKGLSYGTKGVKAVGKTDQEALVEAAKAADRAAAGKRAADVAKATAPMKMSEALGNLNLEGKGKLKVTQSDRTRVGGGNIGGAMFSGLSQVDPFYEGKVWGVGKKGTASSLIRQSDPDTVWTTILGKEDQLKSNPIVFNRLFDAFKREAKAGLLDDELRQKINAGLEPTFGKGVDILDPKLRQKIDTFDKRVLVADLLLGKGIGGEQRGGSIIPGSAILRQETEPLLLHPKQGGDVPTFAVGPRLFSLSGEVEQRPDLHPGFPYLLTGEDKGVVFKPVPGEEAMIDFMARMQEAGKKPGYYEWTMGEAGRGLPSQDITEAYLSALQKKGFAEGGGIEMPDTIPPIMDALEAELRQYQGGGSVAGQADDLGQMFYGTLPEDAGQSPGLMEALKNRAISAAQRIGESGRVAQELQAQAFGDPTRPFHVTNQEALNQLVDMMMAGPMSFANLGITKAASKATKKATEELEKPKRMSRAEKIKPPLTEQAVSQPAASPFERSLQQGYEHGWLHGTTGDITEFKPELRGETTGAASAKKGFFFVRDPISPPPSMIEKSKAEHEEVKRLFSQHNIPVDENSWMLPFQGTGAETASGYAKIGGSRTYKEAMRKVRAAEQRGDWAEYEKYLRIAEDAETQAIHDAQRLVAEYGDRRDEMTDAIQKAIYDRPLPQPDAEKLDEWYKSVMPSGWYNFYNKDQFDNLANQLIEKVGPEKAKDALDAMQRFRSTAAERRLAEGSQEGANVMPVALRYANPYVHDFEGKSYRDETYADLIDKAMRGGHDALILKNTYDPGGGPARLVDVGVVFDPGQIRSKFAEFDPTEVGNQNITKAQGGSIASPEGIPTLAQDLEAQYQFYKAGGPVHMQFGGQPATDEIGFMMEAIDPTKESTGMPIYEATKFLLPQVAKSLVSPAVGLYGTLTSGKYGTQEGIRAGEEAMEKFMLPPADTQLSPAAADVVQNVAKFAEELETKYKLPPLMPELFGPVTGSLQGMGPQLRSLAGQGVAKAREAVSEIPSLPVGMSVEAVGPGGKKLTINELIRMLEAGEEMSPEQRQRAEYSKAQKEKYAAANLAKQAKEPAPAAEMIKVPASESGFFSSVEKAAANLKREEGSGDAFLSDIMKFNPSAGELEATGIVDFLKDKKNVTRHEVNDFINQNKVEIEEVIRGRDILTESERTKLNEIERALSKGWYDIPEQDLDWYESTKQRLLATPAARFDREGLVLPGGTNYKEILLKFPMRQNAPVSTEKSAATMLFENSMKEKYGGETFPSIYNRLTPDEIEKYDMYVREDRNNQKTESILQDKRNNFRHQHWPDDPNTFLHLRMQDMKIGGKKTLVVEEIQSDWHQQGRKKGYNKFFDMPNMDAEELLVKHGNEMTQDQKDWLYDFSKRWAYTNPDNQTRLDGLFDEYKNWRSQQKLRTVPDAPFKKDWYQLGIKRLLKYAADNDYDQVALVGPEEQIRRSELGTFVDGLSYEKNPDGKIKLIAEKDGSIILNETVRPEDLEINVGKDVAKKILESKDNEGTLTGDDLKIGGKGMRQYYDRNYPDYMNKLGRDYGTEAKKTNFVIKEFEPDDVEEVYTGEFDRYGREIMAYKVVDRETGEEIAFEYDFDKVLDEANKKAPSTSMWLMDLPPKMKSDVKIGQPYKKGGAVKKRNGGPIYAPFNTMPDKSDAGQILDFGLQQELNRYA